MDYCGYGYYTDRDINRIKYQARLKTRSTIQLSLLDSILLNVSGEAKTKALWDMLHALYHSKSLFNKVFLYKKLYNLRTKDVNLVTQHLNAFNIVVSQLLYIYIKILDQVNCINLLCSLLNSWYSLFIAICINETMLKFNVIVSSFLSEEMRQKKNGNP